MTEEHNDSQPDEEREVEELKEELEEELPDERGAHMNPLSRPGGVAGTGELGEGVGGGGGPSKEI